MRHGRVSRPLRFRNEWCLKRRQNPLVPEERLLKHSRRTRLTIKVVAHDWTAGRTCNIGERHDGYLA